MEFMKKHPVIRIALMVLLFLSGISLTVIGWKMTGRLLGLGITVLGIIMLLIFLYIYNLPFKYPRER